MRFFLLAFSLLYWGSCHAQSYRGLSIVNNKTVWVSGSKGSILRTQNGGRSWDTLNPKGYAGKDFRDIHAFSGSKAVAMSSGDSGVVLITTDGGKNWNEIYHDFRPGSFLDAMDIFKGKLILVGDGIVQQKMYLIHSENLLKNDSINAFTLFAKDRESYYKQGFQPDSSSSYFAASGSNVQWIGTHMFCAIPIVDEQSLFIYVSENFIRFRSLLPFKKQKAGGAYGFYLHRKKTGVAVGGSFYKPNEKDSVACYTMDGGRNWKPCETMPNGYRSGVCAHKNGKIWVCTGPNGSDYSTDGGKNWRPLTHVSGFNVCAIHGNTLWLAGKATNGVQRYRLKELIKDLP
ncbi:MAG: hypothetical protein EBV15_01130 [Bacteroidetes bacterium]|nr:hypothetical protein [Bacteroidota bacterium]